MKPFIYMWYYLTYPTRVFSPFTEKVCYYSGHTWANRRIMEYNIIILERETKILKAEVSELEAKIAARGFE